MYWSSIYAAEDNAFRLAALKYTGDIMAKRGVTEPDQAIIKKLDGPRDKHSSTTI